MLEEHTLLLDHMKEHYTQARQHETLRTSTTTFLTAAAGLVLGLKTKEDHQNITYYLGLIIFLIGWANYQLNKAYFLGNRFHAKVARFTRIELEKIPTWTVDCPSMVRKKAFNETFGQNNRARPIGEIVNRQIQRVPIGVMIVGSLLFSFDIFNKFAPLIKIN